MRSAARSASVRRAEGLDRLLARLLAASTSFCADTAMLMRLRVFLALVCAKAAGQHAVFQRRADDLLIASRAARRDRPRCEANIGAIEVEADALPEPHDLLLPDASVGAGNAALAAVVAFLDCADQGLVDLPLYVWMRADDLLSVHEASPQVETGEQPCPCEIVSGAPRLQPCVDDALSEKLNHQLRRSRYTRVRRVLETGWAAVPGAPAKVSAGSPI